LVLVLVAGAALAAPALVLEVRAGEREVLLPMRDTAFAYTYRQSIYDSPVREHLRVAQGGIVIERASSPDLRALEYFRWPGEATAVSSGLVEWRAPALEPLGHLSLAIVERGEQELDTGVRRIRLEDAIGTGSATVTPAYRPLAMWLWSVVR
jgi:hypothetical protein